MRRMRLWLINQSNSPQNVVTASRHNSRRLLLHPYGILWLRLRWNNRDQFTQLIRRLRNCTINGHYVSIHPSLDTSRSSLQHVVAILDESAFEISTFDLGITMMTPLTETRRWRFTVQCRRIHLIFWWKNVCCSMAQRYWGKCHTTMENYVTVFEGHDRLYNNLEAWDKRERMIIM